MLEFDDEAAGQALGEAGCVPALLDAARRFSYSKDIVDTTGAVLEATNGRFQLLPDEADKAAALVAPLARSADCGDPECSGCCHSITYISAVDSVCRTPAAAQAFVAAGGARALRDVFAANRSIEPVADAVSRLVAHIADAPGVADALHEAGITVLLYEAMCTPVEESMSGCCFVGEDGAMHLCASPETVAGLSEGIGALAANCPAAAVAAAKANVQEPVMTLVAEAIDSDDTHKALDMLQNIAMEPEGLAVLMGRKLHLQLKAAFNKHALFSWTHTVLSLCQLWAAMVTHDDHVDDVLAAVPASAVLKAMHFKTSEHSKRGRFCDRSEGFDCQMLADVCNAWSDAAQLLCDAGVCEQAVAALRSASDVEAVEAGCDALMALADTFNFDVKRAARLVAAGGIDAVIERVHQVAAIVAPVKKGGAGSAAAAGGTGVPAGSSAGAAAGGAGVASDAIGAASSPPRAVPALKLDGKRPKADDEEMTMLTQSCIGALSHLSSFRPELTAPLARAEALAPFARLLRAAGPADDEIFEFGCALATNVSARGPELGPAGRRALLLSGVAEAIVHNLRKRLAAKTLSRSAAYDGCRCLCKVGAELATSEPLVVMGIAPLALSILNLPAVMGDVKAAGAAATLLTHVATLDPSEGSICRVTADELRKGNIAAVLAALLINYPSTPTIALPACCITGRLARQPTVLPMLLAHPTLLPNLRAALSKLRPRLAAVAAPAGAGPDPDLGDEALDSAELKDQLQMSIDFCRDAIAVLEAAAKKAAPSAGASASASASASAASTR